MAQAVKHPIFTASFSAKVAMDSGGVGPSSTCQYQAVKLTTVAFEVDKCGAGEKAIGILNNAPAINKAAEVVLLGFSPMVVDGSGTAIAPGDRLKVDASGRGIKTTSANDEVIATALENSSAANDVISVYVLGGGFKL